MQRVHFPGLGANIATAREIYVNDDVICCWDEHEPIIVYVYNRKSKETFEVLAELEPSELRDPNCGNSFYTRNGFMFYFSGEEVAKVAILTDKKSLKYHIFNRKITCPWELSFSGSGEGVFDHLENGIKYVFPKSTYSASFIHSERLYMLSLTSLAAHSIPLNNESNVTEHKITTNVPTDNLYIFDTHVVENTVFLYNAKSYNFYRLDLSTFQLDEITEKIPDLTRFAGWTMHDTWLYATVLFTSGGELYRCDLKQFLKRKRVDWADSPSSSFAVITAECPVCLEPFEDPKVFPKCGHSICGECEKKICVENKISRFKTLLCPECRVSTVIGKYESLPTNWALKKHDSLECHREAFLSIRCQYCKKGMTESETFNCELCARKESKLEVLLCGTCGIKNHFDHIGRVKAAVFADKQYRNKRIGHISRDPKKPAREKMVLVGEVTEKLTENFDAFFDDLQKDYRRVNDRVTKLMSTSSITQMAIDKETEELLQEETAIDTKIQILEDWKKELCDCISRLNNQVME